MLTLLLSAHHLHQRFALMMNRIILYDNCCLLSWNPSLYADLCVVLQMTQTQTVNEELVSCYTKFIFTNVYFSNNNMFM